MLAAIIDAVINTNINNTKCAKAYIIGIINKVISIKANILKNFFILHPYF